MLSAVAFYALIIPVSAFAWTRILSDLDERWSLWQLSCIMGSTQLAKYVPGNIAQHIARVSLALKQGMKTGAFTTSVAVETALAILACLVVASTLAIANPMIWSVIAPHLSPSDIQPILLALILIVDMAFLVMLSPLKDSVITYSRRGLSAVLMIRPLTLLLTITAYACNYLLIGAGLFLLAQSMGVANILNYSILTAAFAWAWIVGFLAPGAPAGLGVREGILALIFNQFADEATVLTLVIVLRLVTLMGDCVWFIISSIGLTINSHRQSNA